MPSRDAKFASDLYQSLKNFDAIKAIELSNKILQAEIEGYELTKVEEANWAKLTMMIQEFNSTGQVTSEPEITSETPEVRVVTVDEVVQQVGEADIIKEEWSTPNTDTSQECFCEPYPHFHIKNYTVFGWHATHLVYQGIIAKFAFNEDWQTDEECLELLLQQSPGGLKLDR